MDTVPEFDNKKDCRERLAQLAANTDRISKEIGSLVGENHKGLPGSPDLLGVGNYRRAERRLTYKWVIPWINPTCRLFNT